MGRAAAWWVRHEFCAVFFRTDTLEVQDISHFWLSEQPEVPGSISWGSSLPRMCTRVQFRSTAEPGRRFVVFNTHLDHQSEEARIQGIRLICRAIAADREARGVPALLMGDLNAGYGSPVARFLRTESTLIDAFAAKDALPIGCTFHGFRGGAEGDPIDYIFGTPDVSFRRFAATRWGAGSPPTTIRWSRPSPSDHREPSRQRPPGPGPDAPACAPPKPGRATGPHPPERRGTRTPPHTPRAQRADR